jgi:hypothetical protein
MGQGGAEAISHRLLTEMGSGNFLKQLTSMSNNGIMSSIQGLLSQGVAGAGMGSSGQSSSPGNPQQGAGSDNYGDLSGVWQTLAQNAVAAAQNQTNAQQAGIEIPWYIDITQPGVIDPVLGVVNNGIITGSNTGVANVINVTTPAANAISNVINSITVSRAP